MGRRNGWVVGSGLGNAQRTMLCQCSVAAKPPLSLVNLLSGQVTSRDSLSICMIEYLPAEMEQLVQQKHQQDRNRHRSRERI